MRKDISIVICAHDEGRLAHSTVVSVIRAVEHANKIGIKTEIIFVLDRADEKTKNYFDRYASAKYKIYQTDFGDPGLSRNYGVRISSAKYTAFLDADDLFGKNWLKEAYNMAEASIETCVYYPEYVVFFENYNQIIRFRENNADTVRDSSMIEHNYFNSVHFFTEKTLLDHQPFLPTPVGSGFGYEDWHWFCEILAMDIPIKIVPETCVFYRKKSTISRLLYHNENHTVIPPSKLFEPSKFSAILQKSPNNINTNGNK